MVIRHHLEDITVTCDGSEEGGHEEIREKTDYRDDSSSAIVQWSDHQANCSNCHGQMEKVICRDLLAPPALARVVAAAG